MTPKELADAIPKVYSSPSKGILPTDAKERKETPLARCLFDYFPDALAAVARVSYVGNKQHNGDAEPFWAFNKSMDEADCLLRHFAERGTIDTDGLPHSAKVAWRALAMLQRELVQQGAALPRGAKIVPPDPVPPTDQPRSTSPYRDAYGRALLPRDTARVVATAMSLANLHIPRRVADALVTIEYSDFGMAKCGGGVELPCAKVIDADGLYWVIPRVWLARE